MLLKRYLVCFLICAVQLFVVSADTKTESPHNNSSIVCGNVRKVLNECFNNLQPELLEFLSISKIPATKEEIDRKCDVFQHGMRCVDDYTRKCIEAEKRKVFESMVFGAKSFLKRLCYDNRFQADFLRHKSCFTFIEDDWEQCSSLFLTIMAEEFHSFDNSTKDISNKSMQFCW